jgi:hypothetical protein
VNQLFTRNVINRRTFDSFSEDSVVQPIGRVHIEEAGSELSTTKREIFRHVSLKFLDVSRLSSFRSGARSFSLLQRVREKMKKLNSNLFVGLILGLTLVSTQAAEDKKGPKVTDKVRSIRLVRKFI